MEREKISVIKERQLAIWRLETKCQWLFKVCALRLRDYLQTNELSLKPLWQLDNAQGHPGKNLLQKTPLLIATSSS